MEDIGLDFKNDLFSADIRGISVRDILEKLNREKGVWFQGAPSVLEDKVSVQFKDLSLERGLQRILSNMNYALFFNDGNTLVGVVIIGSKTSQGDVAPKGLPLANKRYIGDDIPKDMAPIEDPFAIPVVGKADSQKDSGDNIFGDGSFPGSGQDTDDPIVESPFSQNPFSDKALPDENPFGQHWPASGQNADDTSFGTSFSSQDSFQDIPQGLPQGSAEDSSLFSP